MYTIDQFIDAIEDNDYEYFNLVGKYNFNVQDINLETLYHYCIKNRNIKFLKILLNNDINKNDNLFIKNKLNQTCFDYMFDYMHLDFNTILFEYNLNDNCLYELIKIEVLNNNISFLDNIKNKINIESLIFFILKNNNYELFKYILNKYNINPNIQDENGNTFFYIGDCRKLYDIIIKYNIDVNIKNNDGVDIMTKIIFSDDYILINIFLPKYKNFNDIKHNGNTILHECCEKQKFMCVKEILKYNVNINIRNHNNDTCLDILKKYNNTNLQYIINDLINIIQNKSLI